jgi:cell pole-organizing protein PopZ
MSNEPSMEDILSSIKRIIAEDTDAALSVPRGRRSVAGAERAVPPSPPTPDHGSPDDDSGVLELTDTAPADEPVTMPRASQPRPSAPEVEDKPPLVSQAALDASRSSIATLSALIVKPAIAGSDTLEGLVREMLKPMLAEWLDQRLPDVVERLVAQEISRITARG